MKPARLDLVGITLLLATALTWWLGESGALLHGSWPAIALVLGIAWVKGSLIALDFMELRHAPWFWRYVVLGWLSVVVGGIAFIRWLF